MSISASSMKLNLFVRKLPSNRLALTNRVYVSPRIFENLDKECSDKRDNNTPSHHPFITVSQHPFEFEAHPDVTDDQICLNRLQRRTCLLRPGERVEVAPFENSKGLELGALLFNVSFLPYQSHKYEIDTDNLAKCLLHNHEGQFFAKGQTIAVDFEGIKLLLTAERLVKNGLHVEKKGFTVGQMLSLTHLTFQIHPNVYSKCVGTKLERGFLNALWRRGAPKNLLDLIYNSCSDAIRANEMVHPISSHVGTALLHYALEIMAPLEVVQYLIKQFPDVLETQGSDVPFIHACSYGSSLEAIEFLLSKSPESMTNKSLDGSNPLHFACLSEKAPSDGVLEFLLQNNRSALTEKNNLGWTPLHCSCATRLHVGVVQSLVKEFPEALGIKDEKGCLPLHLACSSSTGYEAPISSKIVQVLLEKNPSAAKEKNNLQQTPLHCACWSCPPFRVIQLLVEQYPQAIKLEDFSNLTPVDIIERIFAAPQGTGRLIVGDVEITDHKHIMNAELPCLLTRLQSALNPSSSVNDIAEMLMTLSHIGWGGGVGLILDAQSPKLHHLLLDDLLIPNLMNLIGQRCKLITMMEVVKGMPGLFENVKGYSSV